MCACVCVFVSVPGEEWLSEGEKEGTMPLTVI